MTPRALPHHQTVDTSDAHFAEVLTAALEAYEKWLKSGDPADLRAWVPIDRERADILDARQREAQRAVLAKLNGGAR